MREIKFRAWNKENKEMIEDATELFQQDWTNPFTDNDYEVMQYTGLKDKNEVEIYEGDIVKDNQGAVYQVRWSKEEIGFRLFSDRDYFWTLEYEVIGNIYDNKELLK